MSSFEENELKIAEIRKRALGTSKTKAQVDAEIKDYFDKQVAPVQAKMIGSEKASKTTEEDDIKKYYDATVVNERKKLIGK